MFWLFLMFFFFFCFFGLLVVFYFNVFSSRLTPTSSSFSYLNLKF